MPLFGYVTNNELAAMLQQVISNQVTILANQAKGAKAMSAISDAVAALSAKVTAENTVIASAVTLLQGLSQQLKDALANAADDAAAVQAVTDITTSIDQQTQTLAAAVATNTPQPTP